jgi:hypothetical protein
MATAGWESNPDGSFSSSSLFIAVFVNARLQDDRLTVRLIVRILRPLRCQFAAAVKRGGSEVCGRSLSPISVVLAAAAKSVGGRWIHYPDQPG